MRETTAGLIFANLVDFDTLYGHRNDVAGYAANLERFDARLAAPAAALRDDGPADRHRRSRQRPDDAEHRPFARVRAAAGGRRARARRRGPRHPRHVCRPRADAGGRIRRRPAGARHELPGGDRCRAFVRSSSSASGRRSRPQAAKSADSRGRLRPEPEDDVRPAFQRDRDRIIHSKAFRRLKHKTQVFFSPAGDHYRTRLTHTLEVSQIARTIAKVLRLHEELTEAIALGHDLGHTPFGHAGERVLDQLVPGGFNHYEQSLRIVDVLENDGRGLPTGSARRHRAATRRARKARRSALALSSAPPPSKARSCASPTSSPTSITTSTMPCGPGCSADGSAADAGAVARATPRPRASAAWSTTS